MNEILSVFVQEAREQLAVMEENLLRMERGEQDAEVLNAIFRAAHTIKGAAGVVEIHHIEKFTHILENLLDRLRNHEIVVNDKIITTLLQGCDHIGALLDLVEQGIAEENPELASAGQALVETLRAFGKDASDEKSTVPAESVATVERTGDYTTLSDCWHISIRFGRDVLKNGIDPYAFLRYLLQLGEIVHLTTLFDAMPPAHEMDPECCYLGFEITFRSNATKEQIENVFAFCRDECDLHVLPPHSKISDFIELIERLPEENMRLGEILVKSGAITHEELEEGLRRQQAVAKIAQATEQKVPPIGEILVEKKVVQPEIVEAAATKQKLVAEKKSAEARLIRVQADKLDHLIDLVGELVIASASANLLAQKCGQSRLTEATSVISRLVESIRDSALQLRMVQIGETFNRFNRVVRDVSKELGKNIELVISGADTELDKSVVEKIGDPLMHLVRNAIDHGIEPAAVRLARGKPERGRVELNAYHDSSSIVIEVVDDGGGLDVDKIQAKAIERGLIQAGQTLTEQEIINLIFEPGFSTADTVTNLSGRGVGMDVVRRNIQALRGSIEVKTQPGAGSRFIIRLPLTLAIIDGFLTAVGQASYVIPLDAVVECLELRADDTRGHVLNLRGEALPFIRLRELFAIEGAKPARENVVVVTSGGQKTGIVVDQLLGEFQTVIKPLGNLFKYLRGIGGATILGSGEVALILDVGALAQIASQREIRQQTGNAPNALASALGAHEPLARAASPC
ncbi:MAG: chemotaxis protein CheA [Rhodocyclaceae bacterium]|nr:chemotaxis protein CheA [Rhodocyclaceae bacterium]